MQQKFVKNRNLAASDYCLHNQLKFYNEVIHQTGRKRTTASYASFNNFYGKIQIGLLGCFLRASNLFHMSTHIFFRGYILSQHEEHGFFWKTVPGILKVTLRLRDGYIFI